MDLAQFWNNSGGYQIDQSLRFNSADSANLSRSYSSPTNAKIGTFSFWCKLGKLATAPQTVIQESSNTIYAGFDNNNTGDYTFGVYLQNNTTKQARVTTQVFRDYSAWYHIVIAVDTTNGTAANRLKLYVNGSEVTTFTTSNTIDQNINVFPSGAYRIGSYGGSVEFFDGYLAEINFIDGSALTPSSFGETDITTGAWIPKRYTGTYGTNGFYLKFDPAATNGIGHDHSGNGNNFTATGFTTSGTGTDVMSDTPTTNWCTLNPLDDAGNIESNGNLDIQGDGSSFDAIRSTIAMSSGKWYAEFVINTESAASRIVAGLLAVTDSNDGTLGDTSKGYSIFESGSDVRKYNNGTSSVLQSSASLDPTDVQMIAFNADTGKLWFGKNGTWFASGDPVAGTNEAFSGLTSGPYAFAASAYNSSDTGTFNFGQRAFAYTPPTGYKALNTANLPEPTIKDGGKYFDATTYTGASANQSIANAGGFQPDLVWIKNRNLTNRWHNLQDSVRGSGYSLFSNDTYEEVNDVGTRQITFQSNGFGLVGTNADINSSTGTYVAWQWKAGGAGSSNNAGTITSTVSANASAGFSIVTYTGNATSGATVGHGLGVAPNFVIIKDRSAAFDWRVWLTTFGTGNALSLNSTAGTSSNSAVMQAAPSSSVMSLLGSGYSVNNSGNTYVAYCFSEVAGYSKFGSYTGNGSTDGPAVWCGFRPAWLLIKRTDSSSDWILQDSKRLGYNVDNNDLIPNQSYAEATDDRLDQLSNGFKLRSTFATSNASGGTYIFAAFAELPFKYANAR
jgi:hypothetical protein